MATTSKLSKLEGLGRAIDHFRTLDPEFPPQIMKTFLEIARAPGSTMSQLTDRVGTTLASISRIVERLSPRWGKRQGEGLVEFHENPDDRRQKIVTLTPKGERFLATLIELLD